MVSLRDAHQLCSHALSSPERKTLVGSGSRIWVVKKKINVHTVAFVHHKHSLKHQQLLYFRPQNDNFMYPISDPKGQSSVTYCRSK